MVTVLKVARQICHSNRVTGKQFRPEQETRACPPTPGRRVFPVDHIAWDHCPPRPCVFMAYKRDVRCKRMHAH
jgi:hypothetical protein